MIRRRSFLMGCGGIVAAPALALLKLPASAVPELQGTRPDAHASAVAPVVASPQDTVLRIDGWDSAAESTDGAWVQINSSWRATWR